MPWCPVCKNEYKAGYTVCSDCGVELVETLDEGKKAVYFGEEEELLHIKDFMLANGMEEAEVSYDETEETYELLVDSVDFLQAQKMVAIYLHKIASSHNSSDKISSDNGYSEEEIEAFEQLKEAYINEMERKPYEDSAKIAEEYKSGSDSLLVVGFIGVIAIILLHLGVLPIYLPPFTKWMITGVMGFLFVIFIIMGFLSKKSYDKIKERAKTENNTKDDIIKYLKETVNPSDFDADLTYDEPGIEILYFRRMEKLKVMLFAYAPETDRSFAEYILEEIYPDIFE